MTFQNFGYFCHFINSLVDHLHLHISHPKFRNYIFITLFSSPHSFCQYCKPDYKHTRPLLPLHFAEPVVINSLLLTEAIQYGQRVEKAKIFLQTVEGQKLLIEIVTLGYQKIISLEAVGVSAVKIVFTQVRLTPIIQTSVARRVPQEEYSNSKTDCLLTVWFRGIKGRN